MSSKVYYSSSYVCLSLSQSESTHCVQSIGDYLPHKITLMSMGLLRLLYSPDLFCSQDLYKWYVYMFKYIMSCVSIFIIPLMCSLHYIRNSSHVLTSLHSQIIFLRLMSSELIKAKRMELRIKRKNQGKENNDESNSKKDKQLFFSKRRQKMHRSRREYHQYSTLLPKLCQCQQEETSSR